MQEILTLAQSPEAWIALITLIVMEVVLGIDNLIFISILTNKLPRKTASAPGASASALHSSCGWPCSAPSPGSFN